MTKRPLRTLLAVSALVSSSALFVFSQVPAKDPKDLTHVERAEHFERDSIDRTYQLHNVHASYEQNEVLTAVRNMVDPMTKIFLVPSENCIVVHAPEEAQAQVAGLIASIDHPRSRYRLTYTVSELDGTKKVGVQHFSMIVVSGQRNQMKQGSRIPLVTASASAKPGDQPAVYTYIDVGMNFDATLDDIEGGGSLKSKVEQTSVAPDSMNAMGGNPIIRQTYIEGTANLVLGKPLLLGSLDVPSSTRHFDVEVVMQPIS